MWADAPGTLPVSYIRHITNMLPTSWRATQQPTLLRCAAHALGMGRQVERKTSVPVLSQKLFQPNTTHCAFPVYILLPECHTFSSTLKFLHKFWDEWYLIHNNHGSKLHASYLISTTLVSRRASTIGRTGTQANLSPISTSWGIAFSVPQGSVPFVTHLSTTLLLLWCQCTLG